MLSIVRAQLLKVVRFVVCLCFRALKCEAIQLLLLWWPRRERNTVSTFETDIPLQQNHLPHRRALLDISLVLCSGTLWGCFTGLIFWFSLRRQCNKLRLSLNIDLAADGFMNGSRERVLSPWGNRRLSKLEPACGAIRGAGGFLVFTHWPKAGFKNTQCIMNKRSGSRVLKVPVLSRCFILCACSQGATVEYWLQLQQPHCCSKHTQRQSS